MLHRAPLAIGAALAVPILLAATQPQTQTQPQAQAAHRQAGPAPSGARPVRPWLDTLPQTVRDSYLWTADHEEGTLFDWHFASGGQAGGGVFNTGGAQVEARTTRRLAHTGSRSALAKITGALRAQNGNRAVRLMRWTDRPWTQSGTYFPDSAYYSTWIYVPENYNANKYAPWDPGDGGWWNIFQFKCDDANGVSQPIWSLNVDHNDATDKMSLYLYSQENLPGSYGQGATPRVLPARQWVHLEAFYNVATDLSGRISLWQDGELILDVSGVRTALPGSAEKPIWGLGNYTDHIAGGLVEGEATVYFDDCAVSTSPLHVWVP